jgi:hypothetical protein
VNVKGLRSKCEHKFCQPDTPKIKYNHALTSGRKCLELRPTLVGRQGYPVFEAAAAFWVDQRLGYKEIGLWVGRGMRRDQEVSASIGICVVQDCEMEPERNTGDTSDGA